MAVEIDYIIGVVSKNFNHILRNWSSGKLINEVQKGLAISYKQTKSYVHVRLTDTKINYGQGCQGSSDMSRVKHGDQYSWFPKEILPTGYAHELDYGHRPGRHSIGSPDRLDSSTVVPL